MEFNGFIGRQNAEELLADNKITKLQFLQNSDQDTYVEYKQYCNEQQVEEDDQSAEDYFLKLANEFEKGFDRGLV